MVDIGKLEKARGMTAKELAKEYDLSENKARILKISLTPDRYEFLADNRLTFKEMREKLGFSYAYTTSCRSALTSTGFADRKEVWQRKTKDRGISKNVVRFLDKNPSSISAVEGGVAGFYMGALYSNKRIGSMGPDKHKIYYVIGREELARKELEKKLAEPEELVLSALTEPMEINDLYNKVPSDDVLRLEREGKIIRVKSVYGGKRGEKYRILQGDHFYKAGQEQQMAELIIEKIPEPTEMSNGDKHALTSSLKRLKPVFEIVHSYYAPKFVKVARFDKVASETMENLKKFVKDFGIEVETQEDLVKYIGVLSSYGLLDNNAYEIRKERFSDGTDYKTHIENVIQWNSPKLKNKNFADKDLISTVGYGEEDLETAEKGVEISLKYSK